MKRFPGRIRAHEIILDPRRRISYSVPMIEAVSFDTHRFVKRLTGSGFPKQQAETLANEQIALLRANLATKTDIAQVNECITDIEERIKRIEKRMTKIEERTIKIEVAVGPMKFELLKWMIAAMIAQGGLIVTLVKLL